MSKYFFHDKDNFVPLDATRFRLPLPDFKTIEERKHFLDCMTDGAEDMYHTTLSFFESTLPKTDSQILLSYISWIVSRRVHCFEQGSKLILWEDIYHNTDNDDIYNDKYLEHQHLELLQILTLFHIRDNDNNISISPYSIFNDVIENIQILANSFTQLQMKSEYLDLHPTEREFEHFKYSVRLYTQAVRQHEYPDQILTSLTEILSPIDDLIINKLGLTGSDIIRIFDGLRHLIEGRVLDFTHSFYTLLGIESLKHKIAFFNITFNTTIEYESWLKYNEDNGRSNDDVINILHSCSLSWLVNCFTVDLYTISAILNHRYDDNVLQNIIDQLTSFHIDLTNIELPHIFLNNPIWRHPLIPTSQNKYFIPSYHILSSFGYELLNTIFAKHKSLKNSYEKRRAKYLEKRLYDLLKAQYGEKNVFRNVKWFAEGNEYETDILVLYSNYAFIFEAKSHALTPAALRGADHSINELIQNLVIAPAKQANRLSSIIKNHIPFRIQLNDGNDFIVPASTIRDVHCFSITLASLPFINLSRQELIRASLIPEGFKTAPNFGIHDLEIIVSILNNQHLLSNYLIWRYHMEAHNQFTGDTLDIFRLYLLNNVNVFVDQPTNDEPILLIGLSKVFDTYTTNIAYGLNNTPPKMQVTKRWADILENHLEYPCFMFEVLRIMLCIPLSEQLKIEPKIQDLVIDTLKYAEQGKQYYFSQTIYIESYYGIQCISFLAYTGYTEDERKTMFREMIVIINQDYSPEDVLIVGMNIDNTPYPYSHLSYWNKDRQQKHENSLENKQEL